VFHLPFETRGVQVLADIYYVWLGYEHWVPLMRMAVRDYATPFHAETLTPEELDELRHALLAVRA
jgi:hypothetical protein